MRPSATPCGVGKHAFLPTFAAGLGLCKFASGVRLRMRLADERVCTLNWLLYEVSPALHGPLCVVCVHLSCAQCAGPAARILPLLTSRRARISHLLIAVHRPSRQRRICGGHHHFVSCSRRIMLRRPFIRKAETHTTLTC